MKFPFFLLYKNFRLKSVHKFFKRNLAQRTNKPYYSTSNGLTGTLSTAHSTFYYQTENGWESSSKSTSASTTNREKITKITNTSYSYNPRVLLSTEDPAYVLLFANTGSTIGEAGTYWIGSSNVLCGNRCCLCWFAYCRSWRSRIC